MRKTTKGKINMLIDEILHPYFNEYPGVIIIDSLLHAINEQNPEVSLRKFFKHNFPKLLRHITKKENNSS
jgi:hypothetical protein